MADNLFDIKLTKKSVRLMSKLAKHAGGLSVKNSMESIGKQYRKEVDLIFARKQVRQPKLKWAALTEKTLADKKKKGFGGKKILERTGDLRKSMTDEGNPDNISEVGNGFATFGSSNEYGNYHDDLKSARSKIPLRNFSLPSESTYGVFLRIIEEDITEQLKYIGVTVDR